MTIGWLTNKIRLQSMIRNTVTERHSNELLIRRNAMNLHKSLEKSNDMINLYMQKLLNYNLAQLSTKFLRCFSQLLYLGIVQDYFSQHNEMNFTPINSRW